MFKEDFYFETTPNLHNFEQKIKSILKIKPILEQIINRATDAFLYDYYPFFISKPCISDANATLLHRLESVKRI